MLEVGTGFHNELTGRENIFLNGAILGMTQWEIRRKFDEIVAFAEVEKFLDMPVKYYSSGMYVRLAFAIAAHLEPEILIVDEVLAVGDADFQKKCLGKMTEVSQSEGRTVLFVSHSMDAILKLCTRGLLFEMGRIQTTGETKTVVEHYLSSHQSSSRIFDLSSKALPRERTERFSFANVSPSETESTWSFSFGTQLSIDLSIEATQAVSQVELIVGIYSIRGFEVATWSSASDNVELGVHPGANILRVRFEQLRLLPGQYFFAFSIYSKRGFEDAVSEAAQFEILEAATIDPNKMDGSLLTSAAVSIIA